MLDWMNKSVFPLWLLFLNCQKKRKDRFLRILKEAVNEKRGDLSSVKKIVKKEVEKDVKSDNFRSLLKSRGGLIEKVELVEGLFQELGASRVAHLVESVGLLQALWSLEVEILNSKPVLLDVQSMKSMLKISCWCSLGRSPRN